MKDVYEAYTHTRMRFVSLDVYSCIDFFTLSKAYNLHKGCCFDSKSPYNVQISAELLMAEWLCRSVPYMG